VPPVAGVKIQEHLSALAALGRNKGKSGSAFDVGGPAGQFTKPMLHQASTSPAEPLFRDAL